MPKTKHEIIAILLEIYNKPNNSGMLAIGTIGRLYPKSTLSGIEHEIEQKCERNLASFSCELASKPS